MTNFLPIGDVRSIAALPEQALHHLPPSMIAKAFNALVELDGLRIALEDARQWGADPYETLSGVGNVLHRVLGCPSYDGVVIDH